MTAVRILCPSRCNLAHSRASGQQETVEEAVQDGQAGVQGSSIEAWCQGGGQGIEEGRQGAIVAGEQHHTRGRYQPSPIDG